MPVNILTPEDQSFKRELLIEIEKIVAQKQITRAHRRLKPQRVTRLLTLWSGTRLKFFLSDHQPLTGGTVTPVTVFAYPVLFPLRHNQLQYGTTHSPQDFFQFFRSDPQGLKGGPVAPVAVFVYV